MDRNDADVHARCSLLAPAERRFPYQPGTGVWAGRICPSAFANVNPGNTDVDLVRRQTQAVELRLAERLTEVMSVTMQREVPAATHRLPSKMLGNMGGGRIPVDPRDEEGVRTLQTVFQFDVTLPTHMRAAQVGGRAYVRFDHGAEPLARQWYRALRQLFLSHFHV